MYFRKRPVVVRAVQFQDTPECLVRLSDFITDQDMIVDYTNNEKPVLRLKTLESGGGFYFADLGDWIIQGVKNEFYPCKPDIFTATYEACEEPQR
jgi:hypothetical protein